MIRIFDKVYPAKVEDPQEITNLPIRFITFFPLGAAVKRRLVEIIGNIPVPPEMQTFPIFRSGTPDPRTNKVANWWLWDGDKEWRVGKLNLAAIPKRRSDQNPQRVGREWPRGWR
jgi:hypothetical protein